MNKQDILDYVDKRADDFYVLSDKIWDNAEVRFTEKKSADDYSSFLKKEGFCVTNGVAGMETALRAEWGNGKPVIGFLCEYDALPDLSQKPGIAAREPLTDGGNGHGCGHNLLGVGSLIGAIGYKHYLESNGKTGTVVVFGCPAEEGGSGKTFMAREGCFNDLDCAFCWHPASVNLMTPGTMLANSTIRYSFKGTTSHAAAAPEKGRSALDALELMNIGIQFLREHVPSSTRIHYAITDAGGISPNVVPDHASGLYQIRSPFSPTVTEVYERLNKIAKGAAMMTETEVEIEMLKGTSNTVLIPALDKIVYKNMREIQNPVKDATDLELARDLAMTQLDENKIPKIPVDTKIMPYNEAGDVPIPGSSDVGDVSWICPVSQFGCATWPVGTAAHTWQATASGKTDYAHRGMRFAGEIIAASAIDVYENKSVLDEAWNQFREKTNNLPYKCPMPDTITPEYLAQAIK